MGGGESFHDDRSWLLALLSEPNQTDVDGNANASTTISRSQHKFVSNSLWLPTN